MSQYYNPDDPIFPRPVGYESWGFMFTNADGKPAMAERRNVRSYEQAFDGLPKFVKDNLIHTLSRPTNFLTYVSSYE